MMFWLLVTAMVVIALVFVIVPLIRKSEPVESDLDQRNINIAKDKLADLKSQLENGQLTEAEYQEQFKELELSLKNDLEIQSNRPDEARQGRWLAVVILLLVPLLSVTLYFALGTPDALNKLEKHQAALAKQQNAQQSINKMVQSLANRLQQNPDDFEGWVMLGRSFKYMKQFDRAAKAFEQAYRLKQDDVDVMLQYADALAMSQGGHIGAKSKQLIEQALKLSPENRTALWLSGMAKVESGQFEAALQDWTKLEKLMDKSSPSYQELAGLLKALKTRLGTAGEDKQAVSPSVSIQVNVDIDKQIRAKVSPTDTVFIYARALQGPKMPLAIVRKTVSDLPVQVVLNDSMAMIPNMKLSTFKQVAVIARVSKSGSAMPAKGDYLGSIELPKLDEENQVAVTINKKLQ